MLGSIEPRCNLPGRRPWLQQVEPSVACSTVTHRSLPSPLPALLLPPTYNHFTEPLPTHRTPTPPWAHLGGLLPALVQESRGSVLPRPPAGRTGGTEARGSGVVTTASGGHSLHQTNTPSHQHWSGGRWGNCGLNIYFNVSFNKHLLPCFYCPAANTLQK